MAKKKDAYCFIDNGSKPSLVDRISHHLKEKIKRICEHSGLKHSGDVIEVASDTITDFLHACDQGKVDKDSWLLLGMGHKHRALDESLLRSITRHVSVAIVEVDRVGIYPKYSDDNEVFLAKIISSKYSFDEKKASNKKSFSILEGKIDYHNNNRVGNSNPVVSLKKIPNKVWWAKEESGFVVRNDKTYFVIEFIIRCVLNEGLSIWKTSKKVREEYPNIKLSHSNVKNNHLLPKGIKETLSDVSMYGDRVFKLGERSKVAREYYKFAPVTIDEYDQINELINRREYVDIAGDRILCRFCNEKFTAYYDENSRERRYRCENNHYQDTRASKYSFMQSVVEDAIFRVCGHRLWHWDANMPSSYNPFLNKDDLRNIKEAVSTRHCDDSELDDDWLAIDSDVLNIDNIDKRKHADKLAKACIDKIEVYRKYLNRKPLAKSFLGYVGSERYLNIKITLKDDSKFVVFYINDEFVLKNRVFGSGEWDDESRAEHVNDWGREKTEVWFR
ncbi:hypothetical protein [Motiliproteus sediminis]|uniref:hypothetical protein n=1 Tax=Motiliproteus sediminis TaxID=1468178 RepID=UPI001AEFF0FE|nr:hypothetical protein [Motiliproteus sediminis]